LWVRLNERLSSRPHGRDLIPLTMINIEEHRQAKNILGTIPYSGITTEMMG